MLEGDYDIIMADARGHGLSDAPETGYTTSDRADEVAGLVQALGLKEPAILGHSMGASTAAAAARYPKLFGKVLLEDPAWFNEQSPRRMMTDEEREAWHKARGDRIVEQKQMSKQALIALCREQSPSWQEIAAEITVPTLLITADTEKGAIITPEIAQAAQTLNDLIQVALVEGVGQNIRREGFAVYMDAVKGFLAKQT